MSVLTRRAGTVAALILERRSDVLAHRDTTLVQGLIAEGYTRGYLSGLDRCAVNTRVEIECARAELDDQEAAP